jgi:hypothetical protein
MNKIGAAVAGLSLATIMALGVSNARAEEKGQTVDCVKVMNALNGPDVKPRDIANYMHIPLHSVHMCMDEAKKSLGTAHPVVGPGGASTDPNDPATNFKQGAW